MGSLLAIPASVSIDSIGFETEAAKVLARAFQDYGAYAVDNTAWSVYAIETEFGPQGRVEDEFSAAWGFPIDPASKNVPWARDMDRIFGALHVIDNWDESQWLAVSASNGNEGAGTGAPRVPWAAEFGTSPTGGPPPWVPMVLAPAVALVSLGVAFAVCRRYARVRKARRAPARPRTSARSGRELPPERSEDEPRKRRP